MSQVVIGDILPYSQAIAIASQIVFGTNWTANVASDVVVYQTPAGNEPNDVGQKLPYPAGYSVAFIGALEEVQVTLVTPASAGDIITITRQTPADRENLYTNTNFLPTMLNNDFGILTLVDQQAQLVDQKIGPRYNYSAIIVDVVDTILPILGANQVWAKNSNNTQIVPVTINSSGGISGTINIGGINELAYYQSGGTTLSGLATLTNGILVTDPSGVPSISHTLPAGLNFGQPSTIDLTNANAGTLPLTAIAHIATKTVLANSTGGSASPTALTAAQFMTGLVIPKIKIVSSTYDTSTAPGTKAFTGVGFQPRYIILFTSNNNGGNQFSVGAYDGTTNAGNGSYNTGGNFTGAATFSLLAAVDNMNYVTAVVSSLDSDGFTLTSTKTGSPTGTIIINAICIQ